MKLNILFACGLLFLLTGCVGQDQYRLLENRVAALEAENARLSSDLQAKESQNRDVSDRLDQVTNENREKYAETNYELDLVKEKVQQIQTRTQELNHTLGSGSAKRWEDFENELTRFDAAISRNDERLIKLENYMGFEPTAVPADAGKAAGDVLPDNVDAMSETQLYDSAKTLFDKGDMENARIQFENFINKYPDSHNADNARFWIADSYYAEKWYEKAILEYQKVLDDYRNSNKTAAARLKQGYSFAELGEKANARLILNELIKRHPDSNEAKYAKEKLKSLK